VKGLFAGVAGVAVLAVVAVVGAPLVGEIRFSDVTTTAGIKFVHNAGKSGKKYLPETLGAGRM
jgi:hypothetical protein